MISVEVNGEEFLLHEERCLYWPRHRLLIFADVHLGKSETFQQHGLWLSSQAQKDDLDRIDRILKELDVREILFLGDLVHSVRGVTEEVRVLFQTWMNNFAGNVTVAIGNHDKPLVESWPKEWSKVTLLNEWESENFIFRHDPPEKVERDKFYWIGHVHPVVQLESGPDQMRLPSFVIEENIGFLPAFSSLAGGHAISFGKKKRFYPIAESKIFELR